MASVATANDWQSFAYEKSYFFNRGRMIWLLLPLAGMVASIVWLAPHYLLDANYHPIWSTPRCHGRRCGLGILFAFLFYLFLLLPVWIKAPVAALSAGEILAWLASMLCFSFDRKPDFAIGPNGIYGLFRLHYYHVPWSKVGGIHRRRIIYTFYEQNSLTIYTREKSRAHWLWTLGRRMPVRFVFPPVAGFDLDDVCGQLAKFQPDKKIRSDEQDGRPNWLR